MSASILCNALVFKNNLKWARLLRESDPTWPTTVRTLAPATRKTSWTCLYVRDQNPDKMGKWRRKDRGMTIPQWGSTVSYEYT